MKKEIKKFKTSTKGIAKSKVADTKWICDYFNLNTGKMAPATEAFIERLAADLMAWAKTDNALIISDFYTSRGIPRTSYYDWVEQYPNLKASHMGAKELIGSRREIGAMERRYNENIVSRMGAYYSQDWKDMEEWRSKMKTEQAASAQPTQIILGSLQGVKES